MGYHHIHERRGREHRFATAGSPQIDATTFINNGTFFITNLYSDNLFQPPLPYETWDTLNWTNANRMAGDTGFRFDYFSSVGQTNGWSANFQNAGNVNPVNANAFGAWYMLVAATNINNKGTFTVGGAGLMDLAGRSLDLSRGIFGAVGNETNDLAGVRDLYWGTVLAGNRCFIAGIRFPVRWTFQRPRFLPTRRDSPLRT